MLRHSPSCSPAGWPSPSVLCSLSPATLRSRVGINHVYTESAFAYHHHGSCSTTHASSCLTKTGKQAREGGRRREGDFGVDRDQRARDKLRFQAPASHAFTHFVLDISTSTTPTTTTTSSSPPRPPRLVCSSLWTRWHLDISYHRSAGWTTAAISRMPALPGHSLDADLELW